MRAKYFQLFLRGHRIALRESFSLAHKITEKGLALSWFGILLFEFAGKGGTISENAKKMYEKKYDFFYLLLLLSHIK